MLDETLLIVAAVVLATTGVALVLFAGGRLHEMAGFVLFAMAGCCMVARVAIAVKAYETSAFRHESLSTLLVPDLRGTAIAARRAVPRP